MEIEEIRQLLEEKKFNELKNKLSEMKCADISAILDELDKENVIKVFRILSKEKAGMTFSYMESDMREKLIQDLTDAELKNVMDELFMDDTVDLIEEMPSNIVPKILKAVSNQDRKTINELLKYPEDSAGSIMTTEFIDLKEDMTIEQALERIRKIGTDSETIYTCYVLNNDRILQGLINIKEILLSKSDIKLKSLMEKNIISVTGNNFGAGQIEFKEYLSDNMIILNGRFSFDYTKEEYLNTDVLEIYVPELPMKRSLETAVFLTYENTYGRMGTIVKSWIKNKTTICLENLEINSKYGSREFWFMCAYLPMGQRNTFEVEGQVDLHLNNLPWNFREEHAWAVVREKWAYLCFVIEGFYQAEPDTPFAIDLVNFPTDIVSEVPYVAQTTNKSGFGSHFINCMVSERKFSNPGCSEQFLKDASSSFVKVFIVR